MLKTLLFSATVMALAAPVLAHEAQTPSATPTPPASAMLADRSVDVPVTQADFDKYDANKDGTLSPAEFDKWSAVHKMAKPGKTG